MNELRQANYLTQVINTDEKKRKQVPEPELIYPPGERPPPGPNRRRRLGPPIAMRELRDLGFHVKEVDD